MLHLKYKHSTVICVLILENYSTVNIDKSMVYHDLSVVLGGHKSEKKISNILKSYKDDDALLSVLMTSTCIIRRNIVHLQL